MAEYFAIVEEFKDRHALYHTEAESVEAAAAYFATKAHSRDVYGSEVGNQGGRTSRPFTRQQISFMATNVAFIDAPEHSTTDRYDNERFFIHPTQPRLINAGIYKSAAAARADWPEVKDGLFIDGNEAAALAGDLRREIARLKAEGK